jgi:hypothetical protein
LDGLRPGLPNNSTQATFNVALVHTWEGKPMYERNLLSAIEVLQQTIIYLDSHTDLSLRETHVSTRAKQALQMLLEIRNAVNW